MWLRPIEPTDAERLATWRSRAEVNVSTPVRAPISQVAAETETARATASQGVDGYRFVICTRADDTPIGTVALERLDLVNGSASFDISIGVPEAWGHGYGTDALNAIMDFGFGELRLHRIWLLVYAFNERARRSYERAGFHLEGTFRDGVFRRGAWHDVHEMAILRDEWEAQERPRSWSLDVPGEGDVAGR